MNWQTLDSVADSVNPVLGVVALAWPWLHWRGSWRPALLNVIMTLVSVAFAYALSALDARFLWWPSMGLDFSTHTAVAIALVVSLCTIKPSIWFTWVAVFLAYAGLMLYQRYHTLADIGTTAAIITPPLLISHWRRLRANPKLTQ